MGTREYFQFLGYRWDVTRAHELARGHPVARLALRPWFSWLNAIRLNEQQVVRADVSRPLLAVRLRDGGGAALIIDGWHRVARARRDGISELPVVLLDEDEEYEARVVGGAKQSPQQTFPDESVSSSSDEAQPHHAGLPDSRRQQPC